MKWVDVLRRIEAGESRTTEFRPGLGDVSAVGRAVCAFANTEGGVLVLGVDDSRNIMGVREDAERVQKRLTVFLHTGCSAPVSAYAGRHEDPNGWVHWLEVPRQRGFEPLRYDGRVWVRRERSSVEPSPLELQELYDAFGYVLTEESSIEAGSAAHLDLQRFRSYLRALGLDTEQDPRPTDEYGLRNRGVLTELGGALRPTLYGVLAFGKEPQRYPQTRNLRVECVAYEGNDRASRVVQMANAAGRLDDQVQKAAGWFAGLGKLEAYRNLSREGRPLLPHAVIREALVNAVVHREYAITGSKVVLEVFSRRVHVTNPGTLPNRRRAESVRAGARPRSRNQSLANFMVATGFMERRGRGWPRMRQAMREFNGTEPELVHDRQGRFVSVRFNLD